MIDGDEGGGQGEGGLAAGDEEDQLARAGLGGGVGRHQRLAGRLLLLVQRLDDEQLDAFQPCVLLSCDYCADDVR
jgi:hypothetical protein